MSSRPLLNAGIYQVPDTAISFPENYQTRTWHDDRIVLVLSSQAFCDGPSLIVAVAPMSGDLSNVRYSDVVVTKSPANGLKRDSRVILSHIQPMRKITLNQRFGRLIEADWEIVMAKIVENYDG